MQKTDDFFVQKDRTRPIRERKPGRKTILELAGYLIPFAAGLVLSWATILIRYFSNSEWGWKLLAMVLVIGLVFPGIYLGISLLHLRKGLGRIGWRELRPKVQEAILSTLRFAASRASLPQGLGENLQIEIAKDGQGLTHRIKRQLLKRVPLQRLLNAVSQEDLRQRGAEELADWVFGRVDDFMLNSVLAISYRWVIVAAIFEAVVLLLLW